MVFVLLSSCLFFCLYMWLLVFVVEYQVPYGLAVQYSNQLSKVSGLPLPQRLEPEAVPQPPEQGGVRRGAKHTAVGADFGLFVVIVVQVAFGFLVLAVASRPLWPLLVHDAAAPVPLCFHIQQLLGRA